MRSTIKYVRVQQDQQRFVTANFDANGHGNFLQHELGDTHWHPFDPSDEERQFARKLLERFDTSSITWPVINLDDMTISE